MSSSGRRARSLPPSPARGPALGNICTRDDLFPLLRNGRLRSSRDGTGFRRRNWPVGHVNSVVDQRAAREGAEDAAPDGHLPPDQQKNRGDPSRRAGVPRRTSRTPYSLAPWPEGDGTAASGAAPSGGL